MFLRAIQSHVLGFSRHTHPRLKTMIRHLLGTLAGIAVMLVASAAIAANYPLHNPNNPYDVDNNTIVAPRDFLLIVNELLREQAIRSGSPMAASSQTFYWDTTNDDRISPRDALLVANRLLAPTPEPSSVIMAGVGLLVLAGYCWRLKKRHAPAARPA
jgi:hypothetical protein